jgi:hypothetical protein
VERDKQQRGQQREIREHAEHIGRYAMLLLFEPKECDRAQGYCGKEKMYAGGKKEQSRDQGNEGEERCQAPGQPQGDWMRTRREPAAVAAPFPGLNRDTVQAAKSGKETSRRD